MSVTEAQRHQLYESLKTKIGPAEAEIFMNMNPHTNWSELVTKSDLRTALAEQKSDLLRTLGTWLFASQAGVVAAVALVVGLLG